MVPPISFDPTSLVTGIDSPVIVDGASALQKQAINWHLLSRSNAQAVANSHGVETDILIYTIGAHAPCGLRCQIEKRADGTARLFARPQLQNLTKQDQDRDDGSSLEIDGDRTSLCAECDRKQSRRNGRDNAVNPGSTRSHRDQGEHVQAARHQGFPAALKEGPARPEYNRCGEHKLQPVRPLWPQYHVEIREMATHFQGDHRDAEDQANPKPSSHVRQFWTWTRFQVRHFRLKRHSADGAIAGPRLADLGMHGAGVDRRVAHAGTVRFR